MGSDVIFYMECSGAWYYSGLHKYIERTYYYVKLVEAHRDRGAV